MAVKIKMVEEFEYITDADRHRLVVVRSDLFRKGDIVIKDDEHGFNGDHGSISLDIESAEALIAWIEKQIELRKLEGR